MPLIISYSSHCVLSVKNKVINHLTSIVNRIINDSMNERELTYNTALDIVFMNKCHNCGCTPKNDEWSDRAKNLCIDCQDDD